MGNPKAFMEIHRQEAGYRPIQDRIHDFSEVEQTLNTHQRREQASRCMDCGVPFCHWACPLGNKAPEWNDALYRGDWELAFRLLSSTNPFPEFTGRICPALCEKACVLNRFNHEPTTNREDEAAIIEAAFREGYIQPRVPARRVMKAAAPGAVPGAAPGADAPGTPVRVAVIGAGPAGLACADALNQMGYTVTVFEKNEAAGGLLRYGIPNFKLNKAIIDRRIKLMEEEGIEFRYNSLPPSPSPMEEGSDYFCIQGEAGHSTPLSNRRGGGGEAFDAYVLATGTPVARDLRIPGRELKGVHFALELLSQQNRVLAGMEFGKDERITAKGKDVLVIGGGDTGSDCIGTAHRQGCKSVTQIEIMPKPVEGPEDPQNPWPEWPRTLKTTSSHEEGCTRRWNINTLEFLGEDGKLTGVKVQEIDWKPNPEGGRPIMIEKGEPEIIKAELVLLAMGFLKPEHPQYPENVFVCGDAANGASLVVRAMASGRDTAKKVAAYLQR
jgi:glutamate synthase (NADPH/NADH) small chain